MAAIITGNSRHLFFNLFDTTEVVGYHANHFCSFLTHTKQIMSQSIIDKPSANTSDNTAIPPNVTAASLLVSLSLGPGHLALDLSHRLKTWKNNQALLNRNIAHLTIMLLVVFTFLASKLPLSWQKSHALHTITQPVSQKPAPQTQITTTETETPLTLPAALPAQNNDILNRAAVPHTIIPDRSREEVSTYVVNSGDTIFGIAAKFGLNPETILWANTDLESNPDWLWVGQELTILPFNGVYHQVGGGDTLEGIAASYKIDSSAIVNSPLNELDPENPVISAGQWLVVPDGTKPFVPRTVTAYSSPVSADATAGTGAFGWPASGTISQGYWTGHQAIDIAAWTGAPITAADSGQIIYAGWDDTGYGKTIVIDHGNGFQTLYAHMNAYYVAPGTNVAKGEQIGEMGNTGNSTGPHLHLEIRQGTVQRNPIGFLP